MKKIFVALSIFIVITLISSMVFAAVTSKFEVVEDNVCTIKINDYCIFEKRMVSYDLDKRQVTIQLKITNDTPLTQPTGEVMLVIDNSNSMIQDQAANGKNRAELVYESAKNLVSKMLTGNDNLKVGIVSFSTNSNLDLEGTIQDASLVSELTNNVSTLTSALDSIEKIGYRTDLDAGLTLASQHFSSSDANKYIVVLTDGVPNVALNLDKTQQGYGDSVINKTVSTLNSLKSTYKIITMLTGIADPNQSAQGSRPAYTFGQIVEKVFGTTDNPIAGKFHYITDSEIESTIINDIYSDLLPTGGAVTDIKINDYFPQQIVDNFNFAYVSQPTKGTISPAIDDNNRIVWSIDELPSGETATVQYTLTLKDNYDPSIVNVILDTNEKVDITYKTPDGTPGSKTSTDTPKVRVTELKGDTTTVNKIIPKAGTTTTIALAGILIVIATISGIKLYRINK